MAETNSDLLIVNYPDPGYGITDSHNRIRTKGLSTCIAIGGITQDRLFIAHKPDYDHSGQIAALKRMGLEYSEGEMIVFARSPRTMRTGLYKVAPDGGIPMNYGDSITALTANLENHFPNFSVRTLFYADSKYPPHWSFAEIDRRGRVARTDSGSIKL